MPPPPRRSRPLSQGNLAGGASADCRSALYGLLRTGRGRGSWFTAPRPGNREVVAAEFSQEFDFGVTHVFAIPSDASRRPRFWEGLEQGMLGCNTRGMWT